MDTQYLYSVDANTTGLRVEVATYDPQRWARSVERGETKQAGGMTFGESASVSVSQDWNVEDATVATSAKVSMGAIGSHDTATAERRIDVYKQAVDIARFINDALAAGDSIATISRWLDAYLDQDVDSPATSPFIYKGSISLYPKLGE